MNTEAIKGAFKRAQAWVKKNPKTAAAIGVGLAILAYFAIKQGAESTGETLAGNEIESDSGGLESLESSGGGSLSSGGGLDSLLGGSSESSPAPASGGGESLTSPGGFDDSSLGFGESFLPEFPASGFVNSAPAFPASSGDIINAGVGGGFGVSSGVSPAKPLTKTLSEISGGASQQAAKTVPAPSASQPVAKLAAVVSGGLSQQAAKTAPAKVTAIKTDAEKVGLSKYFTGISGGKIYAAGKLTGSIPAPATNKLSSQLNAKITPKTTTAKIR